MHFRTSTQLLTCPLLLFFAALADFLLTHICQGDQQHEETDGQADSHPEGHGRKHEVLA